MTTLSAPEETQFSTDLESSYPVEYSHPARRAAQAAMLFDAIPEITDSVGTFPGMVTKDSEGLFVIPRYQFFWESYQLAVERALTALARQRRFFNCCESLHDLQPTVGKSHALLSIAGQQNLRSILEVPAQFGISWRGSSVAEFDRIAGSGSYTFGLGVFEVACMLLTHPERFTGNYQLSLACPGDRYGKAGLIPCFRQNAGVLRLGVLPIDIASNDTGLATGYLS